MGRLQRLSFASCGLLLAAVTTMPGHVGASEPYHHIDGHDAVTHHGATGWHADHVRWLWTNGTRVALRGHAWMVWEDCTGPVSLAVKARFQRHVDGRWVTTQQRTKRHHFAAGSITAHGHDRELHFRPRFEVRAGDRRHPTRIRFTYSWHAGGQLHEQHHLNERPR